jgi:hypothetical protein
MTPRPGTRAVVVAVLFGAASLAAGRMAAAAEDLVSRANALFDEGKKLLDVGDAPGGLLNRGELARPPHGAGIVVGGAF